jgi:hypothetical protein
MKNGANLKDTVNREEQFRKMAAEAGLSKDAFESAVEARSEFPPFVSADLLLENPPPRPRALIAGILHQGEKLIIGGSSKTNKTWSSIDLAVSVATGADWWGYSTTKSKVLYINFELPEFFMTERIRKVWEAKGGAGKIVNLDAWNLRGYACSSSSLARECSERIKRGDYALIIIDPIYKCLGDGDENSARDIANLCNRFERLAVETGAAIMFAAHFSKGNQAGKSSIDRIGGSGVWARDADTIMTITQHEEDDAYVVETTVRNFPAAPSVVVRWRYPLMVPSSDLDPTRLRKAGRVPQFKEQGVLELLPDNGMTYTDWMSKAVEALRMSESTFKGILQRLLRAHKVERIDGKYARAINWDAPPADLETGTSTAGSMGQKGQERQNTILPLDASKGGMVGAISS